MPSRAREKQLAKLAARRQAEAAKRRRRRNLFVGLGVGVLVVVLVAVVFGFLLSKNPTSAAASITPTPSASTASSPCGSPTPPKDATETKPTYDKAPPMTIDPSKTYTATFVTSCGTFEAQLLAKTAPQGVNSFVFLANKGFYDGLTFHRIVKDFVIQGGDPKGDGTGGPGYTTPVTVTKGSTFNVPGVLAFAHSSSGGNGSQFFVTLAPQPSLNPSATAKYTIFGTITKGMAIVSKIGSVPTVTGPSCPTGESCSPTEPVFILKVTISEKA